MQNNPMATIYQNAYVDLAPEFETDLMNVVLITEVIPNDETDTSTANTMSQEINAKINSRHNASNHSSTPILSITVEHISNEPDTNANGNPCINHTFSIVLSSADRDTDQLYNDTETVLNALSDLGASIPNIDTISWPSNSSAEEAEDNEEKENSEIGEDEEDAVEDDESESTSSLHL